jgi:hypothetical protein
METADGTQLGQNAFLKTTQKMFKLKKKINTYILEHENLGQQILGPKQLNFHTFKQIYKRILYCDALL